MPRPRPPYLHRLKTRHGGVAWYFCKLPGPRIRIRGEFGTPEFETQYNAAIGGETLQPKGGPVASSGSLTWLWECYRKTGAWRLLGPTTRRERETFMVRVLEKGGAAPCESIDRSDIIAAMDNLAAKPTQADHFLKIMRGLFLWATVSGVVKADPTMGVKRLKRKKSKGYPPWNEDDVERYQSRWPIGTRQRVWLDVLLYTGPRRGDAVKIGRQHVRRVAGQTTRMISFKTEKGGELIEINIPILPVLEVTLAAGPCAELAFICGANGKPLTKESFGNDFRDAARAAGVQKSAHGVRKIAATTAANNGATEHQLMAIFGWTDIKTAAIYTREANRRRLAGDAMHTLGGRLASEG